MFDSPSPMTLWQESSQLGLSCSRATAVPPGANKVCVGWSPLKLLFPFTPGRSLVMGSPAILARDLDCEKELV